MARFPYAVFPAALTLFACVATAELKPFVLPWDDASPGLTSLANWQGEPAGTRGWITVDADGHFDLAGERIRFLGVNTGAGDCFPAREVAAKVAARMARFGINNVRFHHMDANWANPGLIDYNRTDTRSLRADSLDRLHYFINELKQNGITSNLNLLVSHDHRAADGLPAEVDLMEWKDKQALSFFNDSMVELQKEYATSLLGSTNPYTGLRLADDPAIAFVEILNENGAIQNWFDNLLDEMPAVFRNELNARWNTWLGERYASTEELLQAWAHRDESIGPNLLLNGDFSSGTNLWTIEQHSPAVRSVAVTTEFDGQPALKVSVTTAGTAGWHVQIQQSGKRLQAGKLYTVSFRAKADEPTAVTAGIGRAHTDYANLGFSLTADLTGDWQFFTSTFEATVDESNARLVFNGFGDQLVTVWLADVLWAEGGEVGALPDGVALETGNVPSIVYAPTGGGDSFEARRDWVRFLIDLEHHYYTTMVDHLRNTLGYQGLIFGTIISNSPPNVQATMDVVDSHAYWKHPVFPHDPWDPVDWTVENESMVNSPGDNTLVGLARQRVRGKPHTVTEYQHPSPITYSAEAPLLVAAYGALQDWDGIWLFDYGTGTHDHFSGFFDQAHHPTKMANMLLAATLFRRFDLRPARKEVTMKFDPETEIESVTARGRAWRVGDGSVLGVPPELALVSRLNLSVGPDAAGLEQPPSAPTGNILAADTGQLVWDTSRWQRGIVKIDTDRTKALVGFIDGRSFDLGGVGIAPGATEQDWCTVGLTLIEGERFDHPAGGRALMIATGNVENTGLRWKDATRTSVGNNWGQAPTLVEVVPAIISLPVSPDRVRVFALDPGGNRQHELNVADEGGRARFVTTTDEGTLWYEIEIAEGGEAAPTIVSQPRSITVEPGGEIRLEVGSEGYPSPAIDWFHEGTKVGSGSSMILTNATSATAGKYHATLTNAAGSIDTRTIEVGVRLLPSESELLVNISTRGWVGAGSDRMIAGFVIAGTGTRELLIRAIGPGLGSFGLTGLLEDPIVEVVNQTAPLLTLHANNDWVPTEVNAAIQRTGAFPYDPIDSAADAALIAAFEAGAFTAMVAGNNSGTGVGLVEVFDASQTGPASIIRLKNLSTRGRIESGNAIMIAGFVVEGEVPMPVLIRGIGPALGGFGVNGVLDDPRLQIFKTEDGHSILIGENDNWGDEDSSGVVSDAFAASGAFALPHGSLDAALVIWLEPGVYTAQVSGYPGENGVGLVEVYGL